ncbi:DUF72 domain-containing protein [Rhodocytophaga rosea]|uniref:DUF72 domain-containing protein n=1 Tax=Rhodocytophaga rosea TaxID=2704465 RepID=A0A6C0GM81_9BACT|nr:DUF72 domain-containing protein [Rhodocytophaga rosea]QHT69135.1 DUF72 domain-containing protein [Rhodocytophaga rosea]
MDFGKLSSIEAVDFTLPPDAVATSRVLSKHVLQNPGKPAIYIGCPIWASKEWAGKIYPASAKEKDYLYHYSRQFNTIELNTTHYRIPDAETIERWKQTASKGFTYCPKFPQVISHERQLEDAENLTMEFCNSIQGLGDALGIPFLQLPPYFMPRQLPVLKAYLDNFPKHIPLAIEFRHPDWFANTPESSAAFALLEKQGVTAVLTDVAGRRDVLHQRLTTPVAMIRFVGHNLHPTDYTRIDAWIERILSWIKQGLQTVYFFVHEPDNITSPELVLYLIKQLNQQGDFQIAPPRIFPKAVQGSLF